MKLVANRSLVLFLSVVGCQVTVGSLSAADFLDGPVPALNFMGKNICMSIGRPLILRLPDSAIATPSIETHTTAEKDGATHIVSIADIGVIRVEERPETGTECEALPRDKFVVKRNPDGRGSEAKFCLGGGSGDPNIYVHYSAHVSNSGDLEQAQAAVSAIAVCRIREHPGYFFSGDTIQVGPVLVGHSASN